MQITINGVASIQDHEDGYIEILDENDDSLGKISWDADFSFNQKEEDEDD